MTDIEILFNAHQQLTSAPSVDHGLCFYYTLILPKWSLRILHKQRLGCNPLYCTERATQAEIHRDLNSFASQVEACRVISVGLGMVNVVLDVQAVEGEMVVWLEGDETEE